MMVMSVGRSELNTETGSRVIQYTFVIGVPIALASDYLRIIGALARIFKDPATEARLRTVDSARDFLAILVQREVKL
jgi:mannitol/fructose-specific phosphotransferase system IIA component (Ntr-type)